MANSLCQRSGCRQVQVRLDKGQHLECVKRLLRYSATSCRARYQMEVHDWLDVAADCTVGVRVSFQESHCTQSAHSHYYHTFIYVNSVFSSCIFQFSFCLQVIRVRSQRRWNWTKLFACMKSTGTRNSPYTVSSGILHTLRTKHIAALRAVVLYGRRVVYVSL